MEIGPVFAVAPDWRPSLLPFPAQGMGWGVELSWYDLLAKGLRMGIVDAVPMRHVGKIGISYGRGPEQRRQEIEMNERGISAWTDVQKELRSHYSARHRATPASR